ncbi:MMPL family transporter [Limosilactobacillus fermentum]|uniref:MMPL family transporter n=1 Tax=Limosilactobacillus fermentum TaxID=1613 RepID=UPI003F9B9BB4
MLSRTQKKVERRMQLTNLQIGLTTATSSLTKIPTGLGSIQSYLGDLATSPAANQFNIPTSELHNQQMETVYDTYMSANRHLTEITVVLKVDPSSQAAIRDVKRLTKDLQAQLKATNLSDATVAVGGQSAQNVDLSNLATSDFWRTALIMSLGIFLVLVFFARSVLQPIMIILTLLGTYFTSISLTDWITRTWLDTSMLSWNTPFFTFIMIVALGVDYSIFLMMRYRDEQRRSPQTLVVNIHHAAQAVGTVVMSAVVILSGTFAALIPSGVMTLIQVAIAVIIGLILLLTACR